MRVEELSEDVYGSLLSRGHTDKDIEGMSVARAFSEYCNWNGLQGWGARLLNVIEELEDAK